MGAMHVKGGKTHWIPYRTEKCSSKTANSCAGNHSTGNHSIRGWHNLGIGIIPGTAMHCSLGTHMWDCCGMGITPRGLASGSADGAPAWNSVCVSVISLQWFFGPEWEVKLQEKCWLLFCAQIIRQHRQRLHLLTCGTLGSCAVYFGKQGSEPLKAVMLFNMQGDPRNLQFREKHPWGVVRGLMASTPSRQERFSGEGVQENWWLLTPLGVKVLGAEQAVGDGVFGSLSSAVSPHLNLLWGVAAFTKLRTFCSSGSFWNLLAQRGCWRGEWLFWRLFPLFFSW